MRKFQILKDSLDLTEISLKDKTTKLDTPLKPWRAKIFGYKNTPAYTVLVASIKKGGIEIQIPRKGRKPVNQIKRFSRRISLQNILLAKLQKKYANMKILTSYLLKTDKYRRWYEVILQNTAI